jgi:hypothetical protein
MGRPLQHIHLSITGLPGTISFCALVLLLAALLPVRLMAQTMERIPPDTAAPIGKAQIQKNLFPLIDRHNGYFDRGTVESVFGIRLHRTELSPRHDPGAESYAFRWSDTDLFLTINSSANKGVTGVVPLGVHSELVVTFSSMGQGQSNCLNFEETMASFRAMGWIYLPKPSTGLIQDKPLTTSQGWPRVAAPPPALPGEFLTRGTSSIGLMSGSGVETKCLTWLRVFAFKP